MAMGRVGPRAHVFMWPQQAPGGSSAGYRAAPALLSLAQSRRQLTGQTVVGRTAHFVVLSDGSPDGNAAAQAVLATAERDFAAVQTRLARSAVPAGPRGEYATGAPNTHPPLVRADQ